MSVLEWLCQLWNIRWGSHLQKLPTSGGISLNNIIISKICASTVYRDKSYHPPGQRSWTWTLPQTIRAKQLGLVFRNIHFVRYFLKSQKVTKMCSCPRPGRHPILRACFKYVSESWSIDIMTPVITMTTCDCWNPGTVKRDVYLTPEKMSIWG